MHIADGILSLSTCAVTGAASAGALAYGVKKTKEELDEKQVPLLGVTAAFIFAAQMINFPILPGTSGHLIGSVLIAILLGPWTASIVMATVLAIQAIFFGDGGIIALTANIFNMAIVANFAGYYIYSKIAKLNTKVATFLGAWAAVVTASLAAAVELSFSGILPLQQVLPVITGIHAVIGLGEGLITLVVVTYLQKVKSNITFRGEGPYYG